MVLQGPITAQFENRRVLITGGLGFIGSNLARRLLELGAYVTVVDSLVAEYGGNRFNLPPSHERLTVNISDVRDRYSLCHLVGDQEVLFNLAGQTSHIDSMRDPFTDLEINCRAQLSILEVCRKVNPHIRVVFASTRQIYGAPKYLPVDEQHPIRPVDVNGVNKQAGESFHLLYCDVYGIPTTVLRLTNTYGPRMRIKDARQTFVGVWIRKIIERQRFEVWGGGQLRDFTYIDDCVDALLAVASNGKTIGKVYNVGGGEVVSLKQLADLLTVLAGSDGYEVKTFPDDRKAIDVGSFYCNADKLYEAVQWLPKIDLETGLSRTLDYFRTYGKHYL